MRKKRVDEWNSPLGALRSGGGGGGGKKREKYSNHLQGHEEEWVVGG